MGATVIDSLLVTIGLDPTQFDRVANDQEKRAQGQRDAAVKRGSDIEASAKKQLQAFNNLKNEVLGLLTVFTAGKAVKDFIQDTINGDAAIGRLSRNIGVSAQDIAAWQGVLRGAGGTSDDASRDLSLFASAAQEISLTGQSKLIPYLNLLHISLRDLDDPSNVLLKIADQFAKMDPRQAAELGREMGLSPATISTLEKGRAAVVALLAEQRKIAPVTEENTKKAEELQRVLADLKTESAGLGREFLTDLAPSLLAVVHAMRQGLPVAGSFFMALGDGAKLAIESVGDAAHVMALFAKGDFAGAWAADKAGADNLLRNWSRLSDDVHGYGRAAASPEPDAAADPRAARIPAPGANPVLTAPRAAAAPSGDFARILGKLQARGLPLATAQGVTAGIGAESHFDPNAANYAGGGEGAHFLGQWRGARLRELLRRYGPNPTEDQQLDFLVAELNGGDKGGAGVLGAGSSRAALDAYVRGFMRPGDPRTAQGAAAIAGDLQRGAAALAANGAGPTINETSVQIDRIDVHTAATDAPGIARGIAPALRAAVPQANVGAS